SFYLVLFFFTRSLFFLFIILFFFVFFFFFQAEDGIRDFHVTGVQTCCSSDLLLGVDDLGGTMRLGQYECLLAPGSLGQKIYGTTTIYERHRHRYEFNCLYEQTLTDKGLRISGRSPDGKFVEMIELPGHPWYVAVQFH